MKFINDFNLKKQADELGVKFWQTPGFMFLILGVFSAVVMIATYFISKNYDNPQVLVISESLIVTIILIIGTAISRFVEKMAQLNRLKSEFVALASHQLRTPISAIKWETELLLSKMKTGLSETHIEKLENIFQLSQRMIRMVNDLLDVVRIDQNKMILRKENFDPVKLIKEVIKEIVPKNNLRNIKVNFHQNENIPEGYGDVERVRLVLENLISNAFKYNVSGGRIEIDIFTQNKKIIFEIKDNGVGIPAEQLDRVFEKFFRSDNAVKYQTEGTGLGLYIAKNIVEQMDGRIWFNSIENVGSNFSFSLPEAK